MSQKPPLNRPSSNNSWYNLHQQISRAFNIQELRLLCAHLSINHEDFGLDPGLPNLVFQLLQRLGREQRLVELLTYVTKQRPHLPWPTTAALMTALPPYLYPEKTLDRKQAQFLRNRTNLLQSIQTAWIDGFLHRAVHHDIFLQLGLAYKPEALPPRPWNLTLQPTAQPIPPEKTIHEVFVENGRSLLILGPPASGKTITLLQLAQTLVTRAHHDAHEPIPIILNLSSWAKEQAALIAWLVEELFLQYQLPVN